MIVVKGSYNKLQMSNTQQASSHPTYNMIALQNYKVHNRYMMKTLALLDKPSLRLRNAGKGSLHLFGIGLNEQGTGYWI